MAGYVSRRAMYYFKSSGWSRCWCILRGKRLLFFADRGTTAALDELPMDDHSRVSPAPPPHEDSDDPAPSPYQFLVQSCGMGWLICVESQEVKEAWLQHLRMARRPMWVPNSAAASCSGCRAGFSMTRRRHHCRSCGMLFCSSCVPPVLSRSLPHLSYNEAVRVCVPCLVKWTSFESNGSSPLEQRNSTLTPGAAGGPADTRGTPSNSFHAFNMQGETWMDQSASFAATPQQETPLRGSMIGQQQYSDDDIKVILATNARLKADLEEANSLLRDNAATIADRDSQLSAQQAELDLIQKRITREAHDPLCGLAKGVYNLTQAIAGEADRRSGGVLGAMGGSSTVNDSPRGMGGSPNSMQEPLQQLEAKITNLLCLVQMKQSGV